MLISIFTLRLCWCFHQQTAMTQEPYREPGTRRANRSLLVITLQVFGRFGKAMSCRIHFGIPQDIHTCQVCDMHVADLYGAYFDDGVPKQVRHDIGLF
jgi:hypothetical protein